MKLTSNSAIAAAVLAIAGTGVSQASTIPAVVNFDPPAVAMGPSIYVSVPGPQTITTAPANFSGGVVLGFATFFPAISFASPPNVYGSADFGNNLSRALSIAVNPAFATTEVSFALFNGETFNQSYIVEAFNGGSLVASQTLTNVAPNFNAGYGLIDLNSPAGITSVTITPAGSPAVWDFVIDTVAFNQSVTSLPLPPPPPVVQPATPPVEGHRHGHREGEVELVEVNFGDDVNDIRGSVLVVTPNAVPEPETCVLVLAGLLILAGFRRKRRPA